MIATFNITRTSSASGSIIIISGTATSYESPNGRRTTASGARAARPLRPSVANEAAIENAATKPRSAKPNGRPINVPMNAVATIKYTMVPNRMVAKPKGMKRSHVSRFIFRSSFNASNDECHSKGSTLKIAASSSSWQAVLSNRLFLTSRVQDTRRRSITVTVLRREGGSTEA